MVEESGLQRKTKNEFINQFTFKMPHKEFNQNINPLRIITVKNVWPDTEDMNYRDLKYTRHRNIPLRSVSIQCNREQFINETDLRKELSAVENERDRVQADLFFTQDNLEKEEKDNKRLRENHKNLLVKFINLEKEVVALRGPEMPYEFSPPKEKEKSPERQPESSVSTEMPPSQIVWDPIESQQASESSDVQCAQPDPLSSQTPPSQSASQPPKPSKPVTRSSKRDLLKKVNKKSKKKLKYVVV